jgi:hypothetical protein
MKLTITDKIFVPVSVNSGLRNYKGTRGEIRLEFSNYNPEIAAIPVKEETNKYILSKEQLEKVISDAFEAGVIREYQERNYERRDYDAPIKEQYINLIL